MSDRANDLMIFRYEDGKIWWVYAGLDGTTEVVDNDWVCDVTLANDNLRLTQGCEIWIEQQCGEWLDAYLYEQSK